MTSTETPPKERPTEVVAHSGTLTTGVSGATQNMLTSPETEYTVLRAGIGSEWTEIGSYNARNNAQAIRQALHDLHSAAEDTGTSIDGTYVAVPARSWQPVDIKAKVEQRVTFEGL